MTKHQVIYVMGVSGCGKSTIGKMLARQTGFAFFDGDDFHPEANVNKMASGQALNDEDRHGWLLAVNNCAKEESLKRGVVIACSALKSSYRTLLSANLDQPAWVFLNGSYEVILNRMEKRKDHFMPPALLKSQFETLEPPEDCIKVSIEQSVPDMINQVMNSL